MNGKTERSWVVVWKPRVTAQMRRGEALKTFSHCCRSRTLHCSVSVLMWQNSSNIVTRKRHWWCFVHSGKFLKKLSFEITAIPSSGWILGEEQIGIHSSKFHQPSAYEFADMSSSFMGRWKWWTWKWRTTKIARHKITGHENAGHDKYW